MPDEKKSETPTEEKKDEGNKEGAAAPKADEQGSNPEPKKDGEKTVTMTEAEFNRKMFAARREGKAGRKPGKKSSNLCSPNTKSMSRSFNSDIVGNSCSFDFKSVTVTFAPNFTKKRVAANPPPCKPKPTIKTLLPLYFNLSLSKNEISIFLFYTFCIYWSELIIIFDNECFCPCQFSQSFLY